ncbi:MAG: PAS domain S-box protein [Candidatus Brocadiae bacterium]|nr:PAS domain S-box protein [Candidatus Brocadiia bacterium]
MIAEKLPDKHLEERRVGQPPAARSPVRLLIVMGVSVFVCGLLIMVSLAAFGPGDALVGPLFGSFLLVVVLVPALYFFLVRPLVRHVDEGKGAEDALAESEERFRLLVETAFEGINICEFDPVTIKRRLVFCNDRYVEMSGYTRDELSRADDLNELIEASWSDEERKRQYDCIVKCVPFAGAASWTRPDGKDNTYEFSAVSVKVGEKYHIIGVDRDITERVRAEQALREGEERLRSLFEAAKNVAFVTTDIEGSEARILDFSPGAEQMFGYSRQEVVGQPLAILHVPEDVGKFPKVIAATRRAEAGVRGEVQLVRKSGQRFPALLTTLPIFDADRNMIKILGVSIDITERVRAEQALRESEERNRMLLASLPQRIFFKDRDSVFVSVNEPFARDLGLSPEQVVGKDDSDFHPADLAEKYRSDDRRIMQSRKPETLVERNVADGVERTVEVVKAPVINDEGEVTGLLGIFTDVTERVRAREQLRQYAERLQELNAELQRSNRDLEDFTYTASHDLREPLRKIHTFGQFLAEDYGDQLSEEGREHLRHIQDAAVRMRGLIQHLLALARVGTQGAQSAPVQPQDVIGRTLDDLSEAIRECDARVTVQEELPVVMADAVQLGQVFQNLIGNALKFRSPERTPEIGITARVEDGQVVFNIADNGIGIEARFLERVFGVLQRLHQREEYEGVGVGLALCEKIIRRHGGKIWAESEPGEGSVFHFALPLASAAEDAEQEA